MEKVTLVRWRRVKNTRMKINQGIQFTYSFIQFTWTPPLLLSFPPFPYSSPPLNIRFFQLFLKLSLSIALLLTLSHHVSLIATLFFSLSLSTPHLLLSPPVSLSYCTYTILQFTTVHHVLQCTKLHYTTLHYTTLLYSTLNNTAPHHTKPYQTKWHVITRSFREELLCNSKTFHFEIETHRLSCSERLS